MEEVKDQIVCLDNKLILSLLTTLMKVVEKKNRDIDDIKEIEKSLNTCIEEGKLNKERLIIRWIQISGNDAYQKISVKTVGDYFKILPAIFTSASMYLEKTNDYLYLLAELVIATDFALYGCIDMGN